MTPAALLAILTAAADEHGLLPARPFARLPALDELNADGLVRLLTARGHRRLHLINHGLQQAPGAMP